jgi:hypothetical protein
VRSDSWIDSYIEDTLDGAVRCAMQRKCLAEEELLRTRPQGRIESLPHPNSP